MSSKQWPAPKDPEDVKDYLVIWTDILGADDIASSEWEIVTTLSEEETELAIDDDDFSNAASVEVDGILGTHKIARVWVSGGLAGMYRLHNRITTTNNPPRTFDQTVKLRVREN